MTRKQAPGAPKRAIGYARVSREEQATNGSLSLETQRAAIADYCRRKGWELVAVHEDTRSGKDLRRNGVQHVLDAAKAGEADAVVVARLDRLTRSVGDLSKSVIEPFRKQGVVFASAAEDFDISTPAGKAMAQMLAVFAEYEREIIAERQRVKVRYRQKQGEFVGRCPYGWRSAPGQHSDPAKWQPVPEEQATIRQIRAWRRRGWTQQRIADELNARGTPGPGRKGAWTQVAVLRVLRHKPPPRAPRSAAK